MKYFISHFRGIWICIQARTKAGTFLHKGWGGGGGGGGHRQLLRVYIWTGPSFMIDEYYDNDYDATKEIKYTSRQAGGSWKIDYFKWRLSFIQTYASDILVLALQSLVNSNRNLQQYITNRVDTSNWMFHSISTLQIVSLHPVSNAESISKPFLCSQIFLLQYISKTFDRSWISNIKVNACISFLKLRKTYHTTKYIQWCVFVPI